MSRRSALLLLFAAPRAAARGASYGVDVSAAADADTWACFQNASKADIAIPRVDPAARRQNEFVGLGVALSSKRTPPAS